MECADVTYFKARAVSKGNPSTTPPATITSDKSWCLAGRLALNATRRNKARTPAMLALATVRNTGSNSSTANRVAGSDPLNMTTPTNPLIHPRTT